MTLREVLEQNRQDLIDQLYDQWGGHYIVVFRDENDIYVPVMVLDTKEQALAWKNPDPTRYALLISTPED